MSTSIRFKIWHYSCVLLHETLWPTGEELLSVCWQTYPRGTFKESVLNNTKVQGIQPSQPIASKQAYRYHTLIRKSNLQVKIYICAS